MNLTLRELRQETPSVVSLIFDKPAGFVYQAGQFLRWEFPVEECDERCNKRSFTIASSPTEDYLMLTTRLGVSRLKETIKDTHPLMSVPVVGPLGRFTIDETNPQPVVMLAGGVGITPLRSMIKYLLDTKNNRHITLFYSNTTPEEIVFKQELVNWRNKASENLRIVFTITKPEESKLPWTGRTGRINEELIKEYVKDLNSIHYYTSGPAVMVQAVQELLKKLGVEESRIHAEIFPGY